MTVSTHPTIEEIAKISSQILDSCSVTNETCELKVNEDQTITIPSSILPQLRDILNHIAQGNDIKIVPIKQELTTTEAASILNVSRPYLVELLESGKIPFRKVGVRRRILYQDVITYKEKVDAQRRKTLAELTAQAQELNMGY
ncbi:excisionase domain protein [Crocosphaera watsonii WH 0402]|uniref:Excisionase domain protein n=1 Tax=Crocosphaera watsonii WH 0402 TaxID=1284629 RepID=T2JM03_CROWT|nr:helix-turn-helix domain-containing protein [Crocosphaera watsonii]CCQ65547.1 excisionase domain protein [Crocosphaera watsonii WH 0402]